MTERFKLRVAVYLVLKNDDKILLMKRAGSGYFDGWYSLPAGHIDGNETLKSAAIREAKEEINIDLTPNDIDLKLTMHRQGNGSEYIDVFFEVKQYQNQICINEPDKCSELIYVNPQEKEEQIIPYIHQALNAIKNNINYLECDWQKE